MNVPVRHIWTSLVVQMWKKLSICICAHATAQSVAHILLRMLDFLGVKRPKENMACSWYTCYVRHACKNFATVMRSSYPNVGCVHMHASLQEKVSFVDGYCCRVPGPCSSSRHVTTFYPMRAVQSQPSRICLLFHACTASWIPLDFRVVGDIRGTCPSFMGTHAHLVRIVCLLAHVRRICTRAHTIRARLSIHTHGIL